VRSGTTALVLDMGPGTLAELRAHVDYRTLDGIVISHLHVDHILDLVELRFTLAYNPIPAERAVPLFLPPDGIATLRRVAQAFESPESAGWSGSPASFDVHEYDPEGLVEIGDLTCSFQPTVHFVPCWAIRVMRPRRRGRSLLHRRHRPGGRPAARGRGAAVVIAEAADKSPGDMPWEQRGHLTPEEAAALAPTRGARTLVLTHIWEELGADDQLRRAPASTSRERCSAPRPAWRSCGHPDAPPARDGRRHGRALDERGRRTGCTRRSIRRSRPEARRCSRRRAGQPRARPARTRPARVQRPDAILLTGGSAFGLGAAQGVVRCWPSATVASRRPPGRCRSCRPR